MRQYEQYERVVLLVLVVVNCLCTLGGLVTASLDYDTLSISLSIAGCVVSVGVLVYCLYFWRKRKQQDK